nr:unnamed protein product [Callosobruchus analis]
MLLYQLLFGGYMMVNDSKRPNRLERHLKPHPTLVLKTKDEDAEQKMKSTSPLNNTVQRRIDDISANIKSQIINKLR